MTAAFQSVDELADRVVALDGRWLALALALQLLNLGFRALAWRNVLTAAYPQTAIRLRDVGASYAAGVALNAYTPARGGEALKVALLRLRVAGSSVPTLAASSSVVLVLDSIIGCALLGTAWALGGVPAVPIPTTTTVLIAGAAVLVGFVLLRSIPRMRAGLREGSSILRTPRAYARTVVPAQLGAWACRIGVAYTLLAAFELPATLPLAAVVVVAGGLSTLVPATPGGVGTQQVLLVYVLHKSADAASALSFSIGMQVGITMVNTLVGLAGLALVFRTVQPATIRVGLRDLRRPND